MLKFSFENKTMNRNLTYSLTNLGLCPEDFFFFSYYIYLSQSLLLVPPTTKSVNWTQHVTWCKFVGLFSWLIEVNLIQTHRGIWLIRSRVRAKSTASLVMHKTSSKRAHQISAHFDDVSHVSSKGKHLACFSLFPSQENRSLSTQDMLIHLHWQNIQVTEGMNSFTFCF